MYIFFSDNRLAYVYEVFDMPSAEEPFLYFSRDSGVARASIVVFMLCKRRKIV